MNTPEHPGIELITAWANELFKGTIPSIQPLAPATPEPPAHVLPYAIDPALNLPLAPTDANGPRYYFLDPTPLTSRLPEVPNAQTPTQASVSPALAQPPMTPSFADRSERPSPLSANTLDVHSVHVSQGTRGAFDAASVRRDFPILAEQVNGRPLIWLDNAATTQKPNAVIDRITYFYRHENSNVHRGAHTLAARSTDAYEAARTSAQRFLNAPSPEEIVFVRGATEGINLVAQSWGRRYLNAGDEVLISWLEHHSNIVPWQLLARERGVVIKVVPVDDRGQLDLDAYERLLSSRTRLVAITHVSNALGTVLPVREIVASAHRWGARVLIDGAQAVSHMPIDVQELDADFYVFSGHKVFGPTGIGVVYGKRDVLEAMPPWQGGGNMIVDVTHERSTFQAAPMRFEAGTGNIADAVGLGAALDYLQQLGMHNVARHEHDLLVQCTESLQAIPGVRIIGTAPDKAGVVSFVLDGHRSEDVGAALAAEGIAVRSGHHCAQPALRRFGLEATVRPSFALYNTASDIEALLHVVRRVQSDRGSVPRI